MINRIKRKSIVICLIFSLASGASAGCIFFTFGTILVPLEVELEKCYITKDGKEFVYLCDFTGEKYNQTLKYDYRNWENTSKCIGRRYQIKVSDPRADLELPLLILSLIFAFLTIIFSIKEDREFV